MTHQAIQDYRRAWRRLTRPSKAPRVWTGRESLDRTLAVAAAHFPPGEPVRTEALAKLLKVRHETARNYVSKLRAAGEWPFPRYAR